MFTGLIQTKGKILQAIAQKGGKGSADGEARLLVAPLKPFSDLALGESIAVNGVCLTVEAFDAASFSAYASAETLRCSNLGALRQGSAVNLERALRLGDRLGGHLVSGHIDGLCEVQSVSRAGSSRLVRFRLPAEAGESGGLGKSGKSGQHGESGKRGGAGTLWRQIIPKGSVAVDGISLTVNACDQNGFEVNVIPATLAETTLADWKPGRQINLETDLIGKYVERMLGCHNATGPATPEAPAKEFSAGLSLDFFRSRGF